MPLFKISTISKILYIFLGFLLLFVLFFVFFLNFVVAPKINPLIENIPQLVTAKVNRFHGTYSSLTTISPYVLDAAVASQDRSFYTNYGIDLKGTIRAVYYTLFFGNRQGASTITEQLAKNVFFHDKDTFQTDISTKIYALYITKMYSKQKIMELYLNDIYFGKGAYGIFNASEKYFYKTPQQLSVAQSAYLIGLINAPSYFQIHPHEAVKEAIIVLHEMEQEHFIGPIIKTPTF